MANQVVTNIFVNDKASKVLNTITKNWGKIEDAISRVDKAEKDLNKIRRQAAKTDDEIAKKKERLIKQERVLRKLKNDAIKTENLLRGGIEKLGKSLERFNKITGAAGAATENFNKTGLNNQKVVDQMTGSLGNMTKTLKHLKKEEMSYLGQLGSRARELRRLEKLGNKLNNEQKRRRSTLRGEMAEIHDALGLTRGMIEGTETQIEVTRWQRGLYQHLGKTLNEVNDVMERSKWVTEEVKVKQEDLNKATRRLRDTVDGLEKGSFSNFIEKEKMLINTSKMHRRSIDELTHSYRAQQAELEDQHSRLDTAHEDHARMSRVIRDQISAIDDHIRGLVQMGRHLDTTDRHIIRTGRTLGSATNRLKEFTKSAERFVGKKIWRELDRVATFSFFKHGAEMGLSFFEVQTKILGIIPLVSVAIGGLSNAFASLGAGILAAGGSLGRLIGGLAILPGLYGALGAGFLGFQNLSQNFVAQAMQGDKQLQALDRSLASAKAAGADKAAKAADDTMSFGASRSRDLTTVGKNKAKDDKSSAANEQRINNIMDQRNEILKKMPPNYQDIVKAVKDLQNAWKELWQGDERGIRTTAALVKGLEAVNRVISNDKVKDIAEEYVKMYEKLAEAIDEWTRQEKNIEKIRKLFLGFDKDDKHIAGFLDNLKILGRIFERLEPYIFEAMYAINEFTNDALQGLLDKLESAETTAEQFGENFRGFLIRAKDAWVAWGTAIWNVYQGLKIILGKSGEFEDGTDAVSRFQNGLVDLSEDFLGWTEKLEKSDVKNYFDSSFKVLRAMGRLILSIAKAMGSILMAPGAADSTVDFFNSLGRALEMFGKYVGKAMGGGLGDKMTNFFNGLVDSFAGKGDAINNAVGRALDIFSAFFKVFEHMPSWVIEWMLTFRLGLLALGAVAGGLLTPFLRMGGLLKFLGKGFLYLGDALGVLSAKGVIGNLKNMMKTMGPKQFGKAILNTRTLSMGLRIFARVLGAAARFAGPIGLVITAIIGVYDAITENFGGITDSVKRTAGVIKDQLGGSLDRLAQAVGFDDIADASEKIGHILSEYVLPVLKIMGQEVGWIVIKIGEWVALLGSGIISTTIDMISSVIETVRENISAVWEDLQKIFGGDSTWGERMLAVVDLFWQSISAIPELFWNLFKTAASGVWTFLGNVLVTTFGEPMQEILNHVIDTLNSIAELANLVLPESFEFGTLDRVTFATDYREAAEAAEEYNRQQEIIKKGAENLASTKSVGKIQSELGTMLERQRLMRQRGLSDSASYDRLTTGIAAHRMALSEDVQGTVRGPAGGGRGGGGGGGGGGTNQTAVTTAQEAQSFAGYTGTTEQGAQIKWDGQSVKVFKGTVDEIRKKIGQLKTAIVNLVKAAINQPKNNLGKITGAWKSVADGIAEPFEKLFGPNGTFYTYLRDALASANNVLTAAGQNELTAAIGPNASFASGTGDSNRPPTTAATGGAASAGNTVSTGTVSGSDLLANLDSSIQTSAAALLADHPGNEKVTSTLRNRDTVAGSGRSQHLDGMAMDVVPVPWSTEAANSMGRWVQENAAAYGVNPDQVFYPARGAASPNDHNDHVHIGFGGAGNYIDMSNLPPVPNFGGGAAGTLATALATMARSALESLGSGGAGGINAPMAPDDIESMINQAAQAYGASAAGLRRVAYAESSYDVNAANLTDINAINGTPSRGLFQFTEPTFKDFQPQAYQANNGAWMGVSTNWTSPKAQALTAAWAFTHGYGGRWATSNLYGDGGHFKVNKPTPIVVGDKGPEEVRVTPKSGPRKGRFSGGSTTVVNSTINLGTLIANEEGIETLTEEIGKQIRKDVRAARKVKKEDD